MRFFRKARSLFAILAASALLTSGATAPASAANTTTLTLGNVIDVKSWEPSQADIGHSIVFYQAVYDNLILRTPTGALKPNLATKWTVAKDGKSVVLDLRKGVKFSDGSTFDANVAKANLDAFIAANGPQTATLAGAKVKVNNTSRITITLANPNPDILYYLSTTDSFMASAKSLKSTTLKTKPVGSGPYILEKSVTGAEYTFKKNPNYWDKSKQKFEKVVIKIIADVNARMNAMISGQIDAGLLDVKTGATAALRGMSKYTSYVDWQGLLLLDRDGKVNPAMKDVRVRQAINYALDRKAMLESEAGGIGQVTSQIFGKASGAYVSSLDNYYKYDPTKAKKLLADAGYASGLTITMPLLPIPSTKAVLEKYLGDVGITINWANVPAVEYRNALLSGKYEAGWFALFQGTAWVNFNLAIAPDGARNIFQNTNSVVSAAKASVLKNPSASNVKAQMTKVNTEIVKQAWFAPFYRVPQLYFSGKRVVVKPQAQNAIPYLYNYSPSGK